MFEQAPFARQFPTKSQPTFSAARLLVYSLAPGPLVVYRGLGRKPMPYHLWLGVACMSELERGSERERERGESVRFE